MAANSSTMEALSGEVLDREEGALSTDAVIQLLRHEIREGQHWFIALLDAIGRWRIPLESIDSRDYRYLVGGEAFDWLLLAERLLDEIPDLVATEEQEALLFWGHWPVDIDDDEFSERIGAVKYSAHLNFLYGVLVEQALQLHIEEEIHKEMRARVWGQDQRVDETMHQRVYGQSRTDLCSLYYEETGTLILNEVSNSELNEFVYWLFRYRLRNQDKARVASDTRKGLAQLTRMELQSNSRRRGGMLSESAFAERYTRR